MKTKNLWVVSMMALVMAACSSDDELNNAGVTQDNEGAVVTLKLDMSNPQTKGNPEATNDQDGSPVENTISNVTVVVKYADETKVFKNNDNGVTWSGDSKTFEFETPAGDATFYVYANVNGADDLSTINWATNLVSNATDVSVYDSFFMSNQNGEGVGHTINADTENNITVNIERAAAKVTVESKSDFSGDENPFGGKLMDMRFALGNMVSKFYLLQQAPISIPTSVSYLPENDQTDNGDWTEIVLGQSASGESSTALGSFNAAYCMENVQSEYKQNNTTYIKFSTVFTPDKALDFNTTGGGDWTVKGTLKDVTEPSSAADAPSFFVVLDGNAEYTSNYIMKSDLYGENNQSKSGLTITETDGGYSITGINGITKISDEYVDGKCFFGPIWVNLSEDGSSSPIYRNDWYHLTVNSIKLPGLPSEPGDGGEIPLTPNVDVTIILSVLDWNLVNREIDL